MHPASNIVNIDINELCARPGSMFDFLASSVNIKCVKLHHLVEFMSPPSSRTTVMFSLLVVTFTYGTVGFRDDPVVPMSTMAVLSWFGVWYYTFNFFLKVI